MSTAQPTTELTDDEQLFEEATGEEAFQAFLDVLNTIEDVHAGHPRDAAETCGAAGCRTAAFLAVIIIAQFGKRVLCPTCALMLIHREVDVQ
jgi:hypothetical protein